MKVWACLWVGLACGSVAIAQEDIASKMINKDTNGAWYIQPASRWARASTAGSSEQQMYPSGQAGL